MEGPRVSIGVARYQFLSDVDDSNLDGEHSSDVKNTTSSEASYEKHHKSGENEGSSDEEGWD